MDLTQQEPQLWSKKELKFKQRLEKVLATTDLTLQRQFIEKLTQQLGIEWEDCAAALVVLSQSNLFHSAKEPLAAKELPLKLSGCSESLTVRKMPLPKMVRYRIEIGQKHTITLDEIKQVFIEEAGVDIKMIGEVDIRYHYSLIELPEGMPPDIYQLLTQASIQGQKLNIKRLKYRDRHLSQLPRKK